MPQPPSAHIPTRVEVVRLLLPRLGGCASKQGAESSFASAEGEDEVYGGVGLRDGGLVGDLVASADQTLEMRRDVSVIEDPLLDLVAVG